jgi:hypothetical protein
MGTSPLQKNPRQKKACRGYALQHIACGSGALPVPMSCIETSADSSL